MKRISARSSMNSREIAHFTTVAILEFVFFAGHNFFNKAFMRLFPHPLFVSFTNGICIIPTSFFVSWAAHNFTRSFGYLVPPRDCLIWMIAGAVLESAITILFMVSYYGSALDFVIIMRLSGLVWNGFLGYLFLGERLSRLGVGCILLIVIGVLIVFSNFQWSVALLTSKTQISIQLLTIFLMSVNSLVTKKVLLVIGRAKTHFGILDYLAWGALLSLPPTFLFSIWKEPSSWHHISAIVTSKMVTLTFFGTILHQLLHFLIAQVHKLASMISMGVLSQVKLLGTLLISHFVYRETNWDQYNFTGLGLLVVGGIVYSVTRIEGDHLGMAAPSYETTRGRDESQIPIYDKDPRESSSDDSLT
jgi:drug/metabolite transporter (DMT)-like permease